MGPCVGGWVDLRSARYRFPLISRQVQNGAAVAVPLVDVIRRDSMSNCGYRVNNRRARDRLVGVPGLLDRLHQAGENVAARLFRQA